MKKRKGKRNRIRAAAGLLAVLLWTEGTLGSVYAAPEAVSENRVIFEEGEEPAPEEGEKPSEGEKPAPEEGEKPSEGEEPAPEEGEKPSEGEEPAPEEGEKPSEGEEPAPEEGEKPSEGEEPAPEEGKKPSEDGEPGESVSENTPEAEKELLPEQIPGAGEALGEAPLLSERGGSMGILSYGNSVISTDSGNIALQTPGQAEIIARYKAYPWKLDLKNTYSEAPSTKSPYKAGHLSDGSLDNALNLLNFIRYVAGVPADVTLSEDYTELSQAGALVNCVNGLLSHNPVRPGGFTAEYDELYEKGKNGCSHSNIAFNYGNVAKSLLNGWMYDGDSTNISSMGHRRWVLNPAMTQTGFGAVGAYSAMYVMDRSGSGIKDYVAWPARNMPIELMKDAKTPWTLSLGSDYKPAQRGQVVVTLKNVASGKTWTFSEKKQDGYFNVNTGGYGMMNCIIFRPNEVSYGKNSQFYVTVTGLTDQNGKEATLRYNVDFFSLSDTPKEVERVTLNKSRLHLLLDSGEETARGELHAALTPSNAADKTMTWNSLHPEVAAVEADSVLTAESVVTAKSVGETTVTVAAVNGVDAACTVKVSRYSLAADGIAFDEETGTYSLDFELREGDPQGEEKRIALMDGDAAATDAVQWTSENENVVKVDADGVVTPVGVGEARVWANVENGLKILSCEIKVENAALPIMQMRESELVLQKGESRQLRVYLSPADTKWVNNGRNYIKWKSDHAETAAFEVNTASDSGSGSTAAEIVSGSTVTVTALAAGKARITAEIVNEAGEPAGGADETQGKGKVSCGVTVQQTAALPAEADRPRLIALTNTQSTLRDVELPEGWSWKYENTSLAQFSGQRSKTFPAVYQPAEDVQPAETLLPVYFLTLEKLSLCVKYADTPLEEPRDVTVLKTGWTAHCYVNYSFETVLEQFEENSEELKNNEWYQKQKQELLAKLEAKILFTSSKPKIIAVEAEKNAAGKVAVSAAKPGEAVLKATLNLGQKSFVANQKLTVAETVAADFAVSGIDGFEESGEQYRYTGELHEFPMGTQKGVNSKIVLNMTGVRKLTVKSSNTKVAALKASTANATQTGHFEIPLMIKAAGTAEITVIGSDPAKTTHRMILVVTDACPGISQETVTVNTWRTVGTDFCLYAAKDAEGAFYEITSVTLIDDIRNGRHSGKFRLTSGMAPDGSRRNCSITAKADTKKGTYKMKLSVVAHGRGYELPITVKVVSEKPVCSVKQKNKLNLFYKDTESLLTIDTAEEVERVSLTGCNYLLESSSKQEGGYYVKPGPGATLNSIKKGTLKIQLKGWKMLESSFTVGVEKKKLKISPVIGTVTLYPKRDITSAWINIQNAQTLPWDDMTIAKVSAKAKGNYEPKLQKQAVFLQGKNLNRADSFRMTIQLRSEQWTEPVDLVCNVKVNMNEPGIVLQKNTLRLNANDAYKGYDAASTLVRWKEGDSLSQDTAQGVRVGVYYNVKNKKAKALVENSQVLFSVEIENGCYQIKARLNQKTVAKGDYNYIVQAAKDGKIWKTPLTIRVVNTAPKNAAEISVKGSIDVLNREGSFMTLTPALKAVNGAFVIPADRNVKLEGRDAHLFRAVWSENGKAVELRAKNNATLVTKFKYTVTPVLTIQNTDAQTEEIRPASVTFQVKQGAVKMSASPKSALFYSGAYNSVTIDMKAVLKGADAPGIEKVILAGNTDAFAYVYNKEGTGTLTMRDTGRAVKGKNYSLQFQIFFAERADNVKPVNVKYTVKVK